MRYAIHAFEGNYGGLHGLETFLVVSNVKDKEEVREIAIEASYEVMDSYDSIINDLMEEAAVYVNEEYGEDYTEVDLEDAFVELKEENVRYSFFKIKDDCTLTNEEIEEAIFQNFWGFAMEYSEGS